MPRIEDILDQLASAQYISILDLKDAYSNIELEDESKQITAFTIPAVGHLEYCRVPFGLKDAGFVFQQLIEMALNTAHCDYVSAYLDDVIVYSPDFETHLTHLSDILSKLQWAGIKLAPNKCQFCQQEVHYLGHILSPNRLKPINTTVQRIQAFPTPKNRKEVKAYLGLAGFYRRFIANFAEIAYPLHQLLQDDHPFEWTTEHQEAFDCLKRALAQDVILMFPRFDQPFQLATDASQHTIGAVLSQEHQGIQQPVAFYSRSLRKHEKNYTVTEKEGLAAIAAVKVFDFYLHDHPFELVIDHATLQHIFNHTNTSAQLARWALALQHLPMIVHYRKGTNHGNADALSRIPQVNTITHTLPTLPVIADEQDQDKWLYAMKQWLKHKSFPEDTHTKTQ